MEQQHIKKGLAPQLWRALCGALKEECATITRDTGVDFEIETPNSLSCKVRHGSSGAWMSLRFDADTPCVWFQTPGPSGYFAFSVNEDGNGVMFVDPKHTAPLFADEAARDLLASIV